jgi:alkanesulfonate monooxygenase SsuD/methylene tetrahydromethanopterin reductase-like flavin-dependent oxidoreductase (luciferase family)
VHVGYEAAFQHRGDYPDGLFIRQELEFCLRAESLGFESVWLTEHHFSNYGLIPDPFQALTYIASRTQHVKLGTAVIVLPWHDPVRVAEQVILADHLSGGRMVIGLGRGLSKAEFEGLRVPQEQSRARFDEYAQLLMTALETGVIEGGALTRQPRRELRPRPLASFSGRLFSASVSPDSGPLIARLGIAPMFIIVKPPELIQADLQRYRVAWREVNGAKRQPPQPLLSAVVVVDPSADRAMEIATTHGRDSHRVAVEHYGMADPDFGTVQGYEFYRQLRAAPVTVIDQPPPTVIHGTPDQVLARFDEYKRRLDMQGILVIFHGVPHEEGERSMQCFVRHCLPELKSWRATVSF